MPGERAKHAGGAPKGPRASPKQPKNPNTATTDCWTKLGKLAKDTLATARHCNPAPEGDEEENEEEGEAVMTWVALAAGITNSAGKKKSAFSPGQRSVRARTGVDQEFPSEEVFTLRAGLLGGELVSVEHVQDAWTSSVPGVFPRAGVKTTPLASAEDACKLFVDRKNAKGFLT